MCEAVPKVEKQNFRGQAKMQSKVILVKNEFISNSGLSDPVAPSYVMNRTLNTI